jgi:hypothetical protein
MASVVVVMVPTPLAMMLRVLFASLALGTISIPFFSCKLHSLVLQSAQVGLMLNVRALIQVWKHKRFFGLIDEYSLAMTGANFILL